MASDSFWEVLAARLHDGPASRAAASRPGSPVRQTCDPGLRLILLGGSLGGRVRLAPVVSAESPAPAPLAPPDAATGRWRRPRRLLTAARRAALDVLRASGAAELNEDFSAADLRRAYRRLALRWHPDRHVTAGPAERTALAETFARVTSAYRQLAGGLSRAA